MVIDYQLVIDYFGVTDFHRKDYFIESNQLLAIVPK